MYTLVHRLHLGRHLVRALWKRLIWVICAFYGVGDVVAHHDIFLLAGLGATLLGVLALCFLLVLLLPRKVLAWLSLY